MKKKKGRKTHVTISNYSFRCLKYVMPQRNTQLKQANSKIICIIRQRLRYIKIGSAFIFHSYFLSFFFLNNFQRVNLIVISQVPHLITCSLTWKNVNLRCLFQTQSHISIIFKGNNKRNKISRIITINFHTFTLNNSIEHNTLFLTICCQHL